MTVSVTGRGPDGMVRRSLLPEDERAQRRSKWVDGLNQINFERLEALERKLELLGEGLKRVFKLLDRPDDRMTRIEGLLGELQEAIECRMGAATTDPQESGDGSAREPEEKPGRSSGKKTAERGSGTAS